MDEKKKGGMKEKRSRQSALAEKKKNEMKSKPSTGMVQKLAGLNVWQLVLSLFAVVGGAVLFVGAVSGWFGNNKVVLDTEYYCGESCDDRMMELTGTEYEELMKDGKSFVVFVDQNGCTTADRLRGYVMDFANSRGIRAYRMMFADARETSLHDYVKYYPSVVMVSRGRVVSYLRADSDEDADYYNDYEMFVSWMNRYL